MVDLTAHLVFRFLPDTPGSTVVAPLALLEVEPGPKHAQHGRSTFVSLLGLVLPAIRSLPSFLARTCTLCCSSRPPNGTRSRRLRSAVRFEAEHVEAREACSVALRKATAFFAFFFGIFVFVLSSSVSDAVGRIGPVRGSTGTVPKTPRFDPRVDPKRTWDLGSGGQGRVGRSSTGRDQS